MRTDFVNKKSLYLLLSILIWSTAAQSVECNTEFVKDQFVEEAIVNFDYPADKFTSDARVGLSIALSVFFDFSQTLDSDEGLCIQDFHGFDHNNLWFGQDTFTRYPHIAVLGTGMGFDISFLEIGAHDPEGFSSAVAGALDFLMIRFGDGISFGEFSSEVYRSDLSSSMADTSFTICQYGSTTQCYNQAMYRLITLPLTKNPKAYLKKGSTLGFASLLCGRGATDLISDLLSRASVAHGELAEELVGTPNIEAFVCPVVQPN